MRQVSWTRAIGALSAALLAAFSAGSARADDAGLIRISDQSRPSVVRITDQVVRGQSPVNVTDPSVQQASLLCPTSLECTDSCTTGECPVCTDSCQSYTVDCPSYHDCPECSPCGCGHECPIIGWLKACHDVKAHYWAACGLPTEICGVPLHCCFCCCRDKHRCPRQRRIRCRSYAERCDRSNRIRCWLAHSKLNYFNTTKPPCGHYTIVYPVDPWYGDARDGGIYAAEGQGGPVSVPLAPVIRHTFNYGWGVPSSRLTPVSHLAAMPYYGYGPASWQHGYQPYYASAAQQQMPAPIQSAMQAGPALR
jgi:hypothetical protein